MGAIESKITNLAIVNSTVYSDADQRKYQSSASLAFVRGIHQGPVNSLHKWPVTRKKFSFDDVIIPITTIHADVTVLSNAKPLQGTFLTVKTDMIFQSFFGCHRFPLRFFANQWYFSKWSDPVTHEVLTHWDHEKIADDFYFKTDFFW